LPNADRVAVIVNPRNSSTYEQLHAMRTAAASLRVELRPIEVDRPGDYTTAFTTIARERPHAVAVSSDPEFFRDRQALVDWAAQIRMPASYDWREFVEAGGLLAYSANTEDAIGRVAVFVDRILKGAKPADLPVEQPTKFELVINLKTAKALGLTIPPSLLLRADQLIE
jgi:putative ABC transport system substrate-binding protein